MTADRYTQTQWSQADAILKSSLFSESERRRMLLELTTMTRFEARAWLISLAVEHGRRQGQRDDMGDAA